MSEVDRPTVGSIAWVDLTVENAQEMRGFYEKVIGWKSAELDMGGYADFFMKTSEDKTVAGVCHARGSNAELPPVWLIYITVANLDESIRQCKALGGDVVTGPKTSGNQGRYCVIRDPAGAVSALHEPVS